MALVNGLLGALGLPFMHAIIPQSPLHVKFLTDFEEEHKSDGSVKLVPILVRETRITTIVTNVLIGMIMFILTDAMKFIPSSVFDGLFLYLAISATYGNQFFDRICLLFSEVNMMEKWNEVPILKVHLFTALQIAQLIVLCFVGFNTFVEIRIVFPAVIFTFLIFRKYAIPLLIDPMHLDILD